MCCTKSFLSLAAGLNILLLNSVLGQDWVQSSAPKLYWQGVASSGDGVRLIAAAYSDSGYGPAGLYASTNSGSSWNPTSAPLQFWERVASSDDGISLVA